MPATGPSFSPYPFARLRRITRREAAFESAIARWLGARAPAFGKLVQLAAGPVAAHVVGSAPAIDPHASWAEIRTGGISIHTAAPSRAIRALAQRWLGGPDELDAPRPLTAAEHGIWCLVVAAALADLGSTASVWPAFDQPVPSGAATADTAAIELAVTLGNVELAVAVLVPRAIELHVPPRPPHAWSFDLPIVVGRAAVPRDAIARLSVRDIITIERTLELEVGDARIGLTATTNALSATVATGYVPRDMALPDDAHLELTVQLGTTRLSLRTLAELAVGQVISLGRPLAGPFEVHAGGRRLGHGELVDIDGELGVRIVSLAQE